MISLRRGINLGGWLSQCDHTKERYENFITEADFRRIKSWHFDHVRIPFDFNVIESETGERILKNCSYLDRAIHWGRECGLNVVLDLHKAAGYDFNDFGDSQKNNLFSNEEAQNRFLRLWDFVSARYAGEPHVAFELLNEVADVEFIRPWNSLIVRTVEAIRKNAPESPIIYGGVCWNSATFVKDLTPPPAKNILYTFHLYEPLLFTHQRAGWVEALKDVPEIPYTEDMEFYRRNSRALGYMGENIFRADCQRMGVEFFESFLKEAIDTAQRQNVPLYCGEYGVIDRANPSETVKWFRDVHKTFEKFDIGHALWNYKEMDFGFIGEHYKLLREAMLCTD